MTAISTTNQVAAPVAKALARLTFQERFEAAFLEIEAEPDLAGKRLPASVQASLTTPRRLHASPWAEATFLGKVRCELATQSRDSTVRAVAQHVGSTTGRVGELLKAFDAFPNDAILILGDRFVDGANRLSQLSFRTLRMVSRIPSLLGRIREVLRLTQNPTLDVTARLRRTRSRRGS